MKTQITPNHQEIMQKMPKYNAFSNRELAAIQTAPEANSRQNKAVEVKCGTYGNEDDCRAASLYKNCTADYVKLKENAVSPIHNSQCT